MRILDHRPGWAIALLLAAAALLAACAPSSAKPAGGQSRAATPAGVATDAIRLQMAGFAGGPGFQQVYLNAKDKIGFLGLDSRDVVDAARRFAAQTSVTYRLAADPQGLAAAKLGVAALPTTVFIGADGTLRGRHVGAVTAR